MKIIFTKISIKYIRVLRSKIFCFLNFFEFLNIFFVNGRNLNIREISLIV